MLDPAADRLYIAATLAGLAVRGIIPWWLVAVLVARELVLGVALLALRRHSYGPLQVSFVGKAATLCLLYAFPLLLLGAHAGDARAGRAGHRLGLRDLGNCPVLVGRRALPGAGTPVIADAGHGEAAGQQAPLAGSSGRPRQ